MIDFKYYTIKSSVLTKSLVLLLSQLLTKAVCLFSILFLISSSLFAQKFSISGSINNENGTTESGVKVSAVQGGSEFTSETTTASGRYKLRLDYGKKYTVEVTKAGFAKRYFIVDLSNVKESDLSSGEDFTSFSLSMFEEAPGANLSALNAEPAAIFMFDKKAGVVANDPKQAAKAKKAEETAKKEKENTDGKKGELAAQALKNYQAKIKEGDGFLQTKDFDKAIKSYEQALEITINNNMDDKEVLKKIDFADEENRKIRDAKKEEEIANKEFTKIVEEGKKLEAKKDLEGAKSKYAEALTKRPDHQETKDLLNKIEISLAEKAAQEKKNADYQTTITAAKSLYDAEQWQEALTKYKEAQQIKPQEKEPEQKIIEISKKIEERSQKVAQQEKFDAAMALANTARDAQKFDEAILKYKEAQNIVKDNPEPGAQINFCEEQKKEKAENAAQLAKQEKFDAAMALANAARDAKKYDEAMVKYEVAQNILKDNPEPATQIEFCKVQIKAELDAAKNAAELAKLETNYSAALQKADQFFEQEKYKEALQLYQEAKLIKPEEARPVQRIDEANQKLALQEAKANQQKQFDDLVKQANAAFEKKNWNEAKDKYNAANEIIANNALVNSKLTEIQRIENEQSAAQKLENDYQIALQQGENALLNNAYQEALVHFQKAKELKPKEKTPLDRIDFTNKIIKENSENQQIQAAYEALVLSAESKLNSDRKEEALTDLRSALALKNTPELKTKIDELERNINDQKNQIQKEANYNDAISRADIAMNSKEWSRAIELYQNAVKIDASQSYPQNQIDLAQSELSNMQNEKQRKATFEGISKEANKLFNIKKYTEAAKQFENALNYADEPADKEITENKLLEIKAIYDEIEGLQRKKAAYDNAISSAQLAEKNNDFETALSKYREAKEIDESQSLSQIKIAEIEQKIAEQNGLKSKQLAFDAQIKKGDDALNAEKFEDAIDFYKAAQQFLPNSPIVQERMATVKNKQADLAKKAAEEAYQNLLTKANKARADGQLQEAIIHYQNASKERPQDDLPKLKIKEIEQEIQSKNESDASLAQRTLSYENFMKAGIEQFNNKNWEVALGSFTQAAALLPEKDEPKQKIEEIKSIRVKLSQEQEAIKTKKEQFNKLISLGDKAFSNGHFDEALQNYEEAYSFEPEITVQRKIEITKEKIKDEQKLAEDKIWQQKLKEADNAFIDKNYDEALNLYNAVLNLKPGHARAQEQVTLINRIKTPSQEISQLQDLGTPTYHSILEGEALFLNAEKQREYERLRKLRTNVIKMNEAADKQMQQEGLDVRGTYSLTKDAERDDERFRKERKKQQLIYENVVRERLEELSIAELSELTLAYKDMIAVQNNLWKFQEKQIESVKGNYKIPNMNEEEVKKYLLQMTNANTKINLDQIELLLSNASFVQGMININSEEFDLGKVLQDLNVALLTSVTTDLRNESNENLLTQQNYLDNALTAMNEYAEYINEQNQKNHENKRDITKYVQAVSDAMYEDGQNKKQDHYEQGQELLKLLQDAARVISDNNQERFDNQVAYSNSVSYLQNTLIDVHNAKLLMNYLRLHKNDAEIKKIFDPNAKDYQLWQNDILLAHSELNEIQRKLNDANDKIQLERKDLANQKELDINKIIANLNETYKENHEKQIDLTNEILKVERDALDMYQERLVNAAHNISVNRTFLNQLERNEITFDEKMANTLGAQFPEGVTEENYVTKDSDGLVDEVKTRRIVVLNGHADVFMRYYNKYGTTFTKNGQAITEYQWTKYTQNAKLPKYKIN